MVEYPWKQIPVVVDGCWWLLAKPWVLNVANDRWFLLLPVGFLDGPAGSVGFLVLPHGFLEHCWFQDGESEHPTNPSCTFDPTNHQSRWWDGQVRSALVKKVLVSLCLFMEDVPPGYWLIHTSYTDHTTSKLTIIHTASSYLLSCLTFVDLAAVDMWMMLVFQIIV